MRYLSPNEQRVLALAQRCCIAYGRRLKRVKAIGKTAKHGLLIATCAGGLLAAGTVNAAAAPSAVSAPALFNEANAAQRAGRLGPAILDYERARLLAPRDRAITQNLLAARQKAGVAAPRVPVWQRPAHWLSLDALAGLASISLLLFSLLFFGTHLLPKTLRGLARIAGTSLGGVALLAAAGIVLRWPELDRAVIVGTQPAARIAPATNAALSFELKPGELVKAENTYGAFVRIRAADGRSGWVSGAEIEKIIPSPM
jgi:hypothetical protein